MVSVLAPSQARRASQVTRDKARSFYLASLFLPTAVRRDVHALYAYYRTVDDLVDEPPARFTRQDILDLLAEWESALHGERATDHPFIAGVIDLAKQYGIPVRYLGMVIEGARLDLDLKAIQTRQELIHYSVLMAGSVGMVLSYLLGSTDPRTLCAANDLGVAMQMTNVLRDVGEDWQRQRIYLPREVLEAHGYSLSQLRRGEVDDSFRRVMRSLAHEARGYYQSGMHGIARLDHSVQFSIYLAATLYSRILDKIEQHDFDVFTRRASLQASEKWMIAMPAYLTHRQFGRRHS